MCVRAGGAERGADRQSCVTREAEVGGEKERRGEGGEWNGEGEDNSDMVARRGRDHIL